MVPPVSVDAVHVRLICELEIAVAVAFPGADGAGAAPAALKATICITQAPPAERVAVARYDPLAVTSLSSAMSPSGEVMIRLVKPVPAADVKVKTVFAATSRSLAFAVLIVPLSVVVAVPDAPPATSNGLLMSRPLYSRILMSG